jgi:hypothetical protein
MFMQARDNNDGRAGGGKGSAGQPGESANEDLQTNETNGGAQLKRGRPCG